MIRIASLCVSQVRRIAGIVVIVALYAAASPPPVTAEQRAQLADRFRFTRFELPSQGALRQINIRRVHPDFDRIVAWISSVGAGVALGDVDGDGLDNDVCLVDPRTDTVTVAPVPATGARFAPYVLDPGDDGVRPGTWAPMGCLLGDLDEDGATDAIVYYWGRVPVLFFRDGPRHVARAVAPQARWFSNAAIIADVDGDGHHDLVVGNYFPDGSHVLDAAGGEVRMQDSMSRAYNGGRKHFLLSHPTGPRQVEFVDADPGLSDDVLHGWTLALGARDFDGDLLPEIYVANDFGPDRLLHNRSRRSALRFALAEGARSFTTPRSKVLGRDSFKGMGVDFGDIDADGDDDIAVSNIAMPWGLLESHFLFENQGEPRALREGRAPFVDRSEPLGVARSGWGWDIRFGDFDNDGRLEIVQATGFMRGEVDRWPELQELATANDALLQHPGAWPRFQLGDDLSGQQHNPFFVMGAQGAFVDLAPEVGMGNATVSRGIATADVDGDGDLDLAVANQWEPSVYYRNDCAGCGAGLTLHVVMASSETPSGTSARPGAHAGSPAIGASVTVTTAGRTLVGQVDGGAGHSGKRAPAIHVGLGAIAADTPVRVDVRWRDRRGESREAGFDVRPGQWTIVLGDEPGATP